MICECGVRNAEYIKCKKDKSQENVDGKQKSSFKKKQREKRSSAPQAEAQSVLKKEG
jgi:hypothetical protein